MGSRRTHISSPTTWCYACTPLQSTFYARCLALPIRGTDLSGRREVLATPTPCFGSRKLRLSTKKPRKHARGLPGIGVLSLRLGTQTSYDSLMPGTPLLSLRQMLRLLLRRLQPFLNVFSCTRTV